MNGLNYFWSLALFLLVVVVGLLLWVSNGGIYLKSQVLTPPLEEQMENPSVVDEYAQVEVHCQQQKQLHINECGYGYPEDDYHCRVEEAQEVFEACLEMTAIEDIDDDYQLFPGESEGELLLN